VSAPERVNADGTDQDDWDAHWDEFGEMARRNPANRYRHAVVLKLLGEVPAGGVLLDIGSGQGEFALDYKRHHPAVVVRGVEHSAVGVRRANESAAAEGVSAAFTERDLLQPVHLEAGEPLASYAVCSEVLEHVDDPTTLMRNATSLLAPGARVVVTVPGGPMSAFDRHIGHYRHFTKPLLSEVLADAGLEVERVLRTGFPFFNVYKLLVIARGERLVEEVQSVSPETTPGLLERFVFAVFRVAFRLNRDDSRFGWQLAAVARVPSAHHEKVG
jgi:2-polyprenyl-3-methyl-5-hydroxy-6-metoxy-1,4-benzoquinol methylase